MKELILTLIKETKLLLSGGIAFMSILTAALIVYHADKEYVMIFSSFAGQLIAALLTYVTKQLPTNGNGGSNAPK